MSATRRARVSTARVERRRLVAYMAAALRRPCPRCEGTGYVVYVVRGPSHYEHVRCTRCNGSGLCRT